MLAGQRPAKSHHHVGGLFDEASIPGDPFHRLQIEVDARVDAPLAEVPVEGALETVLSEQLPEGSQVVTQPLRRNGRVFPSFPVLRLARNERGGPECRLPHRPRVGGLDRIAEQPHRRSARRRSERVHQSPGLILGFVQCVGPELDIQPRPALGQKRQPLGIQALPSRVLDEKLVDALEANRFERDHLGDGVAGLVDILIPEQQQDPGGRARHQPESGLEHRHAGALRADQRTGDMEAAFREKVVEVVPGNAPRDRRKARADQVRVAIAQPHQAAVDLAPGPAFPNDLIEIGGTGRTDAEPKPAVGEDVQFIDVVVGLPRHHRVDAARVVADHAPDRAPAVRRRVRRKRQVMALGFVSKPIEHDAGLDARLSAPGVDCEDGVVVPRGVNDHGHVTPLARQAGARSPRQNRHVGPPALLDRRDDVVGVARHDDPDRNLAVVGGIGGVERARARVESHVAAEAGPEGGFQRVTRV